MARIDVTASPHSAAGDGTTNDTAAIASAISAASEGDCIVFPRGTYETDTISVPHDKSLTFLGEGPQASIIRTRTNNIDCFKSDRGTAVAEDRFETQHNWFQLAIVLRTSGDSSSSFNRCTVGGAPVGCAAIVYTRADLPSTTTNGNDEGWPNTFGKIRDLIVKDNDTTSGGLGTRSCAFYFEGSAYGWEVEGIDLHDIDHGIVVTAPFIRRCTVNTSTETLSYSVDASEAYPSNAELTILQHTGYGTLTGGLSRNTNYFARNPSAGSLQLSTSSGGSAVNLTSAGTAPLYVVARDNYAGGAISPDGFSIDKFTQYGGVSHISLINPENLAIGRCDSYQIRANLLELRGFPSGSRTFPFSVTVENIYSESPQTSTLLSTSQTVDPFVYVDGRAIHINGLQIRGEDADTTRPIFQIAGRGNRVSNFYGVSSFSQFQPDIWVSGEGCTVYGLSHDGSNVYDSGTNNTVEIRRDSTNAALHTVTSGTP